MPEPSDVQRASERFKAALLRNERAAASDMVRVYGGIWKRTKPQLDALLQSIEEARQRGEQVQSSAVARSERLGQLLAQVEQEVGQYAAYVDESVRRQQSAAIEAAAQDAEGLTRSAMGDAPTDEARLALRWNRLPREAVAELVGQLASGAPLDVLLGELGPEAAQRVKDALLEGLALGRNPRVIARDVRRNMGMPLTRSLRISRTETLRAYRGATLANFRANSDTVTGWRWSASHSTRTCPACLAMDGKVFPLDKPMPAHISCRCSVTPVTVSWQDLGIDAPEPDLGETGAQWFARQPASVQREMLGDEGYTAYKSGKVTLDDFVGVRKSRVWGDQVKTVNLKGALAAHQGVVGIEPATPSGRLRPPAGDQDARNRDNAALEDWLRPSNTTAAGAKDEIADTLSSRAALPYDTVNDIVKQWAYSSNDNDMRSLSLQEEAVRLFETELSPWQKSKVKDLMDRLSGAQKPPVAGKAFDLFDMDTWGAGASGSSDDPNDPVFHPLGFGRRPDPRGDIRATLTEMHAWTQRELGRLPGETVTLYRGMRLSSSEAAGLRAGDATAITSNALESWSVRKEVAEGFATTLSTGDVGIVVAARVPKSRVLSTARTGFGCLNEWEVVVVGNQAGDTVMVIDVY